MLLCLISPHHTNLISLKGRAFNDYIIAVRAGRKSLAVVPADERFMVSFA